MIIKKENFFFNDDNYLISFPHRMSTVNYYYIISNVLLILSTSKISENCEQII